MKLITKGNFYYEIQILMWVIMWQHDMTFKPMTKKKTSIRWGRLYIWLDESYNPSRKIWFKRKLESLKIYKIFISFWALIDLIDGGFSITRYEDSSSPAIELRRYRFFWNDKMIDHLGDITYIAGHWNTRLNGSSKALTYDVVENHGGSDFYSKEWHASMKTKQDRVDFDYDYDRYEQFRHVLLDPRFRKDL